MPCIAHASPSKSNQRFWYLLWSGCWMCLARFVRFAFCLFTFHRKWLMMVATTTTVNRIFPTWWFHVLISFYLYERAAAALLRWFSVLNCLHSWRIYARYEVSVCRSALRRAIRCSMCWNEMFNESVWKRRPVTMSTGWIKLSVFSRGKNRCRSTLHTQTICYPKYLCIHWH